jgi:hypothetical protein
VTHQYRHSHCRSGYLIPCDECRAAGLENRRTAVLTTSTAVTANAAAAEGREDHDGLRMAGRIHGHTAGCAGGNATGSDFLRRGANPDGAVLPPVSALGAMSSRQGRPLLTRVTGLYRPCAKCERSYQKWEMAHVGTTDNGIEIYHCQRCATPQDAEVARNGRYIGVMGTFAACGFWCFVVYAIVSVIGKRLGL